MLRLRKGPMTMVMMTRFTNANLTIQLFWLWRALLRLVLLQVPTNLEANFLLTLTDLVTSILAFLTMLVTMYTILQRGSLRFCRYDRALRHDLPDALDGAHSPRHDPHHALQNDGSLAGAAHALSPGAPYLVAAARAQ